MLQKFEYAAENPQAVQTAHLMDILRSNQYSCYGRKYNFAGVTSYEEYAATVPIVTFSELSPYVERMKCGENNILTCEDPVRFNLTSGTTEKPKYIPVTQSGLAQTESALQHWMYSAIYDHPGLFDHSFVCISGASEDGWTESGIPYGCASGLMYELLPREFRGSFALPFSLSKIEDYDLRYYLMARFALERDVSFIVTPNPSTLLRLAEVAIMHQDDIINSIRSGGLFYSHCFSINKNDLQIIKEVSADLKPNTSRANLLEKVVRRYGRLLPSACWKNLKLIGCWLGGSMGFQTGKLTAYFGNRIPIRDIGYLASEGTMTIPQNDNTTDGVLALVNNFYEFIPDKQDSSSGIQPLLCHQLEEGVQYRILLTNSNGLYRYDINDIVEVCGFHSRTPQIAFICKGEDMLNISGEKLHPNHFAAAVRAIEEECGPAITGFKAIPNYAECCYEIMMHFAIRPSHKFIRHKVLPVFDKCLKTVNIEYAAKRASGRLNPPCLHLMDGEWGDCTQNRVNERGGINDVQYKQKTTDTGLSETDKTHITETFLMS